MNYRATTCLLFRHPKRFLSGPRSKKQRQKSKPGAKSGLVAAAADESHLLSLCSLHFFGLNPERQRGPKRGLNKNFGAAGRGQRPKPPMLRSLTSTAASSLFERCFFVPHQMFISSQRVKFQQKCLEVVEKRG